MEKIKQRRYRAQTWRKIVGRFEESGLAAPAFCARERISIQSLYRWRSRLGGESDRALVARAADLTSKTTGFIDLGDLRSGASRFEVRLELGAGIVLSIARG
ncbi:MAG: IS66 family insertion sequence element accessory protein TnpB [Steroidobacteraceae bacterium]